MDIETLRKMRNTDFGQITSAFDKIANPQSETKSYADDRFWKLQPDKAGNGTATIRFLPKVEGDELPWVRIFNHAFQGPSGRWYIENSLTTFGEKDPVSEINNRLWNSGSEASKDLARKQKRKLKYITNILVVDDPKQPENNGKVFLFQFGKKIFDKIMDKARPTFEDEKPVNVFDLWEGADFKMRMRKVDGYANYDQSQFMEPSALRGGDEQQLLEVVGQQYKLSEFLDRSKYFKTFEELSKKLSDVLGDGEPIVTASDIAEQKPVSSPKPKAAVTATGDDDDGMLSYFQKIAEEE